MYNDGTAFTIYINKQTTVVVHFQVRLVQMPFCTLTAAGEPEPPVNQVYVCGLYASLYECAFHSLCWDLTGASCTSAIRLFVKNPAF